MSVEYKRDKKGKYIEVVGDYMNIEKVYIKDDIDVYEKKIRGSNWFFRFWSLIKYIVSKVLLRDLDMMSGLVFENKKSDDDDLDNLGYWKWRGDYVVKGKNEWKVKKGKREGRLYKVEEDRLLYFDKGDIVWDNEGKVIDSGVWRFRKNKNKGINRSMRKGWLGIVIVRFGGVIIILFLLFRLLNRIF